MTLSVAAGQKVRMVSRRPAYGYLALAGRRAVDRPIDLDALGVELVRRIIDVETGEAVTRFRCGQVYEVRLGGCLETAIENLLVTVARGVERDNERTGAVTAGGDETAEIDTFEIRDDRVLLFHTGGLSAQFNFVYRVRAMIPGDYLQPAFTLEALHDPTIRFLSSPPEQVRVEP